MFSLLFLFRAPAVSQVSGIWARREGSVPNGRGVWSKHTEVSAAGGRDNGIQYHGGPVMVGAKHVYYVWYGDWSRNADAVRILQDFAASIGGSPYFNINTTYEDGQGRPVQNAVGFSGAAYDAYSKGTSLSDDDVLSVVESSIRSGNLPSDPMGIYFVLTSADVAETAASCHVCGWHKAASIDGADIKYAFVQNGDRCPFVCEPQLVSPNGNAGADGMASVVAHELEEATVDPHLDAWYQDGSNEESADLCAGDYGDSGQVRQLPSGAAFNMVLGDRKFLIQRNWVNAGGGYCALEYH